MNACVGVVPNPLTSLEVHLKNNNPVFTGMFIIYEQTAGIVSSFTINTQTDEKSANINISGKVEFRNIPFSEIYVNY